jgi:hypothetical protein
MTMLMLVLVRDSGVVLSRNLVFTQRSVPPDMDAGSSPSTGFDATIAVFTISRFVSPE